jgi:hypothetical protein
VTNDTSGAGTLHRHTAKGPRLGLSGVPCPGYDSLIGFVQQDRECQGESNGIPQVSVHRKVSMVSSMPMPLAGWSTGPGAGALEPER